MLSSASRWKGAAYSALFAMASVALAYQLPASIEIDVGRRLEGALGTSGFFDAEGSHRWSRARSEIVFSDPGARDPVRIELLLSGFRPRGGAPPRVAIEAAGKSFPLTLSRRIETVSVESSTSGLWSSTTRVEIRSETFTPGEGDERALGVRVHRARLLVDGPAFPPLRQVFASGISAALLTLYFGSPAGAASGVLLGLGFLFFRFYAALFAPALAGGALGLAGLAKFLPGPAGLAKEIFVGSARSLLDGARVLRNRAVVPLAGLLLLATFAAYVFRPRFEIDLGTALADPLLQRFAGIDRDESGVLFRRSFPDGSIDLRDFGASSPWVVSVKASADAAPEFLDRRVELERSPWGFRSGHVLRFPGLLSGRRFRIASIEVNRGRSLPPLSVAALVLLSSALVAASFGACGLPSRHSLALGATFGGLFVSGLAACPVFFVPFSSRVAIAAFASLLAASSGRGALSALFRIGLAPEPSSWSLAIATGASCLFFLAIASPLYSGGHFAYHMSVAEEISQGKFFLYYFPGPDNMLSHQPQWGNLTVPHPSLYHTVTSPLALLPREWFPLTTKIFLSLLLFGIILMSSVVAHASGGRNAGTFGAVCAAALPTGSQLLGLGHLMTIFGTFAAALALGFVALAETRLVERAFWLTALGLSTFAFLSYTGSLLFGSIALAFTSAALLRSEPGLAKRLSWLLLASWGLALALYYIHWVSPFFGETLPKMLSGAGSDRGIDWAARLRLAPEKLEYTFGTSWAPVAGVLGLSLAEGRPRRLLLYGWALSLPLFSVLDLAFNFLLKHHYFSFPAVAVGLGLVLQKLAEKRPLGTAVFALIVVYLSVGGFIAVYQLATGAP